MPRGDFTAGESTGGPRLLVILATALAVAGAGFSTFAESFEAAVARLRRPAVGIGMADFKDRVGLDGYRSEADALAKAYEPAAAGFLRSRTKGPDIDSALLALLTLAVLADEPNAAAELAGCLRDSGFSDAHVLMALTYAPAPTALASAEEALARLDAQPKALAAAAALFRFFGDAHHASLLEADLARLPESALRLREEATRDLVALRQRLARPDEERRAWAAQDLTVWRAIRLMPDMHSVNSELWHQAGKACAATRFTPAFLKDRLGASTIDLYELRLLLMIAGIQRETAVVPELTMFVETARRSWGDAMDALLSIGTREALAPVERLIVPPKPPAEGGPIDGMSAERLEEVQRGALVSSLCERLARCGDRATLRLMESLAADTAYPPRERDAFARARDAIRARLGAGP
ncbi:hypothetical protein [Paludisphaera soli]|uniref:hypothetical protein n=1 Tax=Paludisphaera soli TaxID=2712865 RepID=UPI0013ECDB9B|nr:hypothetical protein [Paludisphaera soli]